MKIKMIKRIISSKKVIQTGEVLNVRVYPDGNLLGFNRPFQVIEGEFSGCVIPLDACIKLEEEKTYTEKQWNDLENYYLAKLDKGREQTAIFQGLARDLTDKVKDKNKEIEKLNFFLEATSTALVAACQSIEILKENKA